MKRTLITVVLLSTLPTFAIAMTCPTNFSIISAGDSIDKVKALCGKPDKEVSRDAEDNTPQEWSYFIPQTVGTKTSHQEQGTLKTSVTFDENGKAINISVNGIGVGNTTICGSMVQLGDTRDRFKSVCGEPSFVNKQGMEASKPPVKITDITYNSTPPVTLEFIGGELQEGTK